MKKVLALALVIIIIFSAIPITVSASESVITITTAAQLAAIADNLSGNYKLGNDIDLSDYGAWTPIGGSTAFSGTFEGNGKTIKGLTVNTSNQYGGLFGNVSGTVKNLNVKGAVTVNMSSSSATSVYAGLVAGNVGLFGTVDSCSAEGNVTVKLNHSSSSFITPKGYAYAGGVIGNSSSFYEFSELSHKSGTVTATANMTNKGNAFAYAGGVAGKSGATIVDSYNKGDVSATATASSGETTAYSGGISGYGKNFATSYNTGDISASGTTVANAGAIAGYATGKATNCYYLSGCATKAFGGYSADTAPTATALSKTNSYGKNKYVGFDFDNVWESALLNTPKHYDKDEIITGTVAVSGTFQYGKTLTADMSGVTPSKAWNGTIKQVKYQWYRGVEEKDPDSNQTVVNYTAISKATSNTYKITSDDIGKYIKLVVRGRLTYGGMLESTGTLVEKLTPEIPTAPVVEELGDTYVIIKAVSGAEYGYATYKEGFLDVDAGWNNPTWQSSNKIEGLSPSTKYGLYVRIPESTTTNASANSAVTEITTYEEGYDPYAVKGSVSVSGTGAYGNTLTADVSGLVAAESGATYSYQWNRDGVAIEDATSETYKIAAEDIGTKISVTVTAKSPFTGTFTSSAVTVSLGQPANLSIKNTDTGIALSWSKVDGATEYVVYKKGTISWSEVATVTTNSYSVGALTSGTTYQYTVSAKRGSLESSKDSTGVKTIYLDKPQNLTADEYTANQATLSWSAVSNAKSYNIYKGTATGTLSLVASGVTGTEYQDTTTKNGTTYGYAIAAVSGDYVSAQSGRVTLKITGTASHRYNAWVIDKEPTCTESGTKHRDCTECTDVQTVTIPATGHNYGDWTVTKEATCSETGTKYRICSTCSYKEEETIPAKDHVYGAWVFDKSSTCTEEGLKHCECSVCGHYKEVIISAKGHILTDWVIDSDATVYKAGSKHTECIRCDEIVETVVIPQLVCQEPELISAVQNGYAILFTWGVVEGADSYVVYRKSGSDGLWKRIATVAGDKTQYTDYAAEDNVMNYYTVRAVNEAGNSELNRDGVGCEYHVHSFGDWEIIVPATCTTDGEKYRVCVCGEEETEIIEALGHDYSDEWTIDVEATCTEEGSKSHHCTVCGDKADVTVIVATGHNYILDIVLSVHPHTKTYICSYCEDEKTETAVVSDCIECNFTITPIDSSSYKVVSYIGTATDVKIPATYNECAVTTISNGCFKGNTTITSVRIADGVTSIGSLAFMNCTSLERVLIPASVTIIGSNAFYGFTGTIYCFNGSTAHEYAIANNIDYVLLSLQETESTQIDYDNFVIYTSVENSSDIAEIFGVSDTAVAIPVASYVYGNLELYGTGTIVTVFDGDEYVGDFTLIVEGDLNGDSVCDVLDAAQAQLYSVGLDEPSENEVLAANGGIADEIDVNAYQNVVNTCLAS